jgi:predicted alpha/beta hydrolase family esterase
LEKLPVAEESVLIGHSRGVAFLLRWLSETKRSVAQLILVAPNLRTESTDQELQYFYDFEIDSTIPRRVADIVVFTSENDDVENMESAKRLSELLHCRTINLPNHGHFITQDMGGDEFPELIEEILS